jgi:hypothetical protein
MLLVSLCHGAQSDRVRTYNSFEFLQGAAMVLAVLSRVDGPEMPRYLASQWDLSLRDFEAAGVEEFDLNELRHVFAVDLPVEGMSSR